MSSFNDKFGDKSLIEQTEKTLDKFRGPESQSGDQKLTKGAAIEHRILHFRALASRVLVVAVARPLDGQNAWTAYIDAVPGNSHRSEAQAVAEMGNKLEESLARLIFNWLEGPYVE